MRKEVARLKQLLILEEIRNGVEQFPVSKNISPPVQKTPPTKQEPVPMPVATKPETPPLSGTPSENSSQPKKAKGETTDKKKGGGVGGACLAAAPVDVSWLDMRVGRIQKAWKHPDADGLYVEEVDVGEEGRIRTICSGLVNHVPLDDMQGRLGVFLCNLKTAKMRGVPSEGMIMCANTPEKVEILDPPSGSLPGDRVVCDGYDGTPDALLNPKKKIVEAILPDMCTNEEGVACYKGAPFTVAGKGVCCSQTMKGTRIK